jgi:hypothetical protein
VLKRDAEKAVPTRRFRTEIVLHAFGFVRIFICGFYNVYLFAVAWCCVTKKRLQPAANTPQSAWPMGAGAQAPPCRHTTRGRNKQTQVDCGRTRKEYKTKKVIKKFLKKGIC